MPKLNKPSLEDQRAMAIRLAWSLLWTPYQWGGDDHSSLDCSGMYVEILGAVGRISRNKDYAASGLYRLFKESQVDTSSTGCLVFWWIPSPPEKMKIIHVEMLVNNYWVIGASGGGSPRFNVYEEIQKDPLLKKYYGHLSEGDIEKRQGDFILSLIKRELFRKQAIEQNAFIKVNLLGYRGEDFILVDPFKES